MKKNAYIIKAMIFTAVIMLLTVTAGVSVLNSSIWERDLGGNGNRNRNGCNLPGP